VALKFEEFLPAKASTPIEKKAWGRGFSQWMVGVEALAGGFKVRGVFTG